MPLDLDPEQDQLHPKTQDLSVLHVLYVLLYLYGLIVLVLVLC